MPVNAYYITENDNPLYARLIRRERTLKTEIDNPLGQLPHTVGAMIVHSPSGRDDGLAAIVAPNVAFPFCYEVSIHGYPGFGTLDTLRGRLNGVEFEFSRLDDAIAVRNALPPHRSGEIYIGGGTFLVPLEDVSDLTAQLELKRSQRIQKNAEAEAALKDGRLGDYQSLKAEISVLNDEIRELQAEIDQKQDVGVRYPTGRWFFGFATEPEEFVFAETSEPTEAERELFWSEIDNSGDPVPEDFNLVDDNGFSTNTDTRTICRVRDVSFVPTGMLVRFKTLVDVSVPTPMSPGALCYLTQVAGFGYSVLSAEPRVYQNLPGLWEDVDNSITQQELDEVFTEPEEEGE